MFQIQNFDAQAAIGFVLSQRTHIESGVYQIKYPDVQYRDLVDIDTTAHPFAKTVTYFSSDIYGKANWINGNADDIPLAGSEMSQFETPVFTAAIGYGYGWEELGVAQQMGYPLTQDGIRAARRAAEEFIDGVGMRGDATKNFQGIINNSSVAAAAAPTGSWGTATAEQMIADFNTGLNLTRSSTLYTGIANTVLLPHLAITQLSNKLMPNSIISVLSYLMENNVYTQTTGQRLTIRGVLGLETAGAGSTRRMVTYRKDREVLKMHIPMPHRFLNPYAAGPLRVEVPGVMRLGGVDIRQPALVKYTDGI